MANIEQNNLSLLNYRFRLSNTPNLEYKAQQISIPGMNLGAAAVPTPHVPLYFAGNITYDELSITFLVGEQLKDYLEIYNWMIRLGYPDRLEQYRNPEPIDCSVLILDSTFNPYINVRFTDIFPTSLSGIDFDSTLSEVQYATATVNFRFNRYYFDII
jgi:hypothetical protein